MNGDNVERKALYDEVSRLRNEVKTLAVEGCAHERTHTSAISTLHQRIDNEKRIRETDFREERQERQRDTEAARVARDALESKWETKVGQIKADLDRKMEATRNQILVGIVVALVIAVAIGKIIP